ncbi:TPA: DUF190 domain-containing protein [Legionella pneumophila]|nr:DUF190 domain-containing protein [Legionella pneumophila]HDO8078976.1 DUF190 domain-containing protein [Legionella pneumophila]HDO8153414.1 DUF190 domain-containing protein [Legionella pneumophila]
MKNLIESVDVIIVRVYMFEKSRFIRNIFDYLENEAKIRGITMFRAIKGFGDTGEHYVSIVDGVWELPIIIEFFDTEDKIKIALEYLSKIIKTEHIVYWKAKSNI